MEFKYVSMSKITYVFPSLRPFFFFLIYQFTEKHSEQTKSVKSNIKLEEEEPSKKFKSNTNLLDLSSDKDHERKEDVEFVFVSFNKKNWLHWKKVLFWSQTVAISAEFFTIFQLETKFLWIFKYFLRLINA